MGLFDKLFGKTNTEQPSTTSQINVERQEEWEFYLTNIDNKPGSIYVDLGLSKVAPMTDKPNLVWVSLKLTNPREDGLPSNDESKLLWEIEDALTENIKSKHNAVDAGSMTADSLRYYYFFFADTTLYEKTISEALVGFPTYEFDYGVKEDKDWSAYFDFLYPSPQQYQSILNRRVVDQIEKAGDMLTKSREVIHWIYFKSESDLDNYLEKIKDDNFTVVSKDCDKSWGEFAHKLQIKRVDKVDLNSVDEYVIYLWKLANECNGDYNGWETSIEKD
jgi:uncharacterized protein (TIGR01619 family)